MRIRKPNIFKQASAGFLSFILVLSTVSSAVPFFVSQVASAAPVTDHVIINEIMAYPAAGEREWIELYNPTASPIDLTGWNVTFNNGATPYPVPAGNIASHGFIVIEGPDANSYLINSTDTIGLINNLAISQDQVTYSGIGQDTSYARSYDAALTFIPQDAATKNSSNGDVPTYTMTVGGDGDFTRYQAEEFTVTTHTNDDNGDSSPMVRAYFTDGGANGSYEYKLGSNFYPFSGSAGFGPATGFEYQDGAVSTLRATYITPGSYISHLEFREVGTDALVAQKDIAFTVTDVPVADAYSNGFETGTGDWNAASRVAGGTNGVLPAAGAYHAQIAKDAFAYTKWGNNYSSQFPSGGYVTEQDVYLDMTKATGSNDKRIDFSSAINNPAGTHRRDFVVTLGTNPTVPNQWLVNVGNGTPGNPSTPGNAIITTTGWYTIQHSFRDNGSGVLEVAMKLIKVKDGSTVGTWVSSDPSDVIGLTVGGNRYGWFVTNDFDNLAIDNTRKGPSAVPTIPDTTKPVAILQEPLTGSFNPTKLVVSATDNTALTTLTGNIYNATNTTLVKPCSKTTIALTADSLECPVPANLAEGTYTIRANARDAAGNTSATVTRQFSVDHTGPMVGFTSPAANSTAKNTITVSGTATDNLAGVANVTIRFSKLNTNGTCDTFENSITAPVVSGVWQTSFDTKTLDDGRYCITAFATDNARNNNGTGTEFKSFVIDNTKPTAVLTTPVANVYNPSEIVVNASDAQGLKTVTANIYNATGSTLLKSCSKSANGATTYTLTCTVPNLPDGTYLIRANASDNANSVSATTVRQFKVDNTAPASTDDLDSLVSGTVTIHQTLVDNDMPRSGKLEIWKLDVFGMKDPLKYYTSLEQDVDSANTVTYVVDTFVDLYGDGDYTATFTSWDMAGNNSTQNTEFTVDNTHPSAMIDFSAGTGSTAKSFNVAFSEQVNVSEAEDPANYFLNNWPGAGGSGDLTGDATVVYNLATRTSVVTFTNPDWYISGEQEWGVQNIHDLAGHVLNPNPTSAYSSALVAPSEPGAPSTASPTNNPSVIWNWTPATDPGGSDASGVKEYQYNLDDSITWISTTNTFATTPSLSEGSHKLSVRAIDNAGKVGDAISGFVIVDTEAPVLDDESIMVNVDGTYTFTGSTSDNTTDVEVSLDGTVMGTVTPDLTSVWSYTTATPLSVGSHTFSAVSTDAASNESNIVSKVFNIEAGRGVGDGTATLTPVATITSPITSFIATTGRSTGSEASGSVLGVTTTNDQDILGEQTTKSVKTPAVEATSSGWNIFGLAWYWWILILAALAGLVWFLVRRRNTQN